MLYFPLAILFSAILDQCTSWMVLNPKVFILSFLVRNLMVTFSFQFITLQNEDERARLVPVLNTILKLSPDEVAALSAAAKGKH